jgi:aminotransferase EvaB
MIKTFDYRRSLPEIEDEITEALSRVLHSGRLLLGEETEGLETEFAQYAGARHCIAVNSGTGALQLALMALGVGVGDEVVTVSNTCVPTISAIRSTGATPVFVDVREFDLTMNPELVASAATAKTRCILPVHLWGQAADIDALVELTRKREIPIIEDCAQAHGTRLRSRHVGTLGRIGCFSFYPTKNLGAYGDAGAVLTNDSALAERLRSLRVYGYDGSGVAQTEGTNARISELQAAILRVKLRVFPTWLERRRRVAEVYNEAIENPEIQLPPIQPFTEPSYHQYVIRCRDRRAVIQALEAAEIGFGIHYPMPVHLMPAYQFLGGSSLRLPVTMKASSQILSLPIHEGISPDQANRVAEVLNQIEGRRLDEPYR